MESNITKIAIKNSGPSPWIAEKEGMALPLWCSLSLITLPSGAQALPPPRKKKRTFPKTECRRVACDSLACHPGEVTILLSSSCSSNQSLALIAMNQLDLKNVTFERHLCPELMRIDEIACSLSYLLSLVLLSHTFYITNIWERV